jgi:hypothetical protein
MIERGDITRGAATVAFLIAGGLSAAQAQAPVDLSGTWVLNVEESDNPQEELRRWLSARGSGSGGPGGAPSTGAGENPQGGYDPGGAGLLGAGGGLMALMQRFSENAERLTIVQNEPEVTITNAAGASNMVFTDGRLIERVGEDGGKTKVKTRWKKDRMIIDIDFPSRPSPAGGTFTPGLMMAYSIDKKGRLELASTVSVGAAIPPFTVERVYDREATPQ